MSRTVPIIPIPTFQYLPHLLIALFHLAPALCATTSNSSTTNRSKPINANIMTTNTEHSVQVSNISPSATEKTIADFFSFCGKISKLYLNKDQHTAVVQFDSESAAKTALLLTNALIIDRPIVVALIESPTATQNDASLGTPADPTQIPERDFGVPDEQRSKTSVVASLLAAGYVLGDSAIDKAREYDEKIGVAATAQAVVAQIQTKAQQIDQQFGISDKASAAKQVVEDHIKQVDEKYQISEKANLAVDVVKSTFQDVSRNVVNKVQENPASAQALERVQAAGTAVTSYIKDQKEQTTRAIDEKQRERGKVEQNGEQAIPSEVPEKQQ
ncbi:hypothetical protein PROFUN_05112 [Planoprotostelium fungivorum]|uniref:RRM domain-containing protein n=1 Tax=Planoprotostelium fungivorum TaxID=1890364 RepID=A0A2P6NRN4_9EUKA|nr:hypothetical protein PROFUN_05112 [Planoprotostelium fungivorum]